jgi:hypothetical protein
MARYFRGVLINIMIMALSIVVMKALLGVFDNPFYVLISFASYLVLVVIVDRVLVKHSRACPVSKIKPER